MYGVPMYGVCLCMEYAYVRMEYTYVWSISMYGVPMYGVYLCMGLAGMHARYVFSST